MAKPTAHEMHEAASNKAAEKKTDEASHEIAEAAGEAVPKGTPDSGRQQTETAVKHK